MGNAGQKQNPQRDQGCCLPAQRPHPDTQAQVHKSHCINSCPSCLYVTHANTHICIHSANKGDHSCSLILLCWLLGSIISFILPIPTETPSSSLKLWLTHTIIGLQTTSSVTNFQSKNKADGTQRKITTVDTRSWHVHMCSHTCTQTTYREV